MKLSLLLLTLYSSFAIAEVFEVHSVASRSIPGSFIVKFADGRVGFWENTDAPEVSPEELPLSVIEGDLSEFSVLTRVRMIGRMPENTNPFPSPEKSSAFNYTPTVYPSYNFAADILDRMRRSWTKEAQCYDRAHVWVYEEAYAGRFLQKAFLFFSDAYIERYKFKWWFHVAPYAQVKLRGETVERVMDPTFVRDPLKFKLWTDIFMKNDAECRVIQKYSEYSTRPGEDDCYILKASLYNWQPRDLEAQERTGLGKKNFIGWEIRHAYKEGFGIIL